MYEVVVHVDGRQTLKGVDIPDSDLAEVKQTLLCSIFYGVIVWY